MYSLDELSKSGVLLYLRQMNLSFEVPDLLEIHFKEFCDDQGATFEKIRNYFKEGLIAIRSSAPDEDGAQASMAGMFESFLNVDVCDAAEVISKVDAAFKSYENKNSRVSGSHIFIQKMVTDVAVSGVAFSRDLNSFGPYFVINYDDVSGNTASVTSGNGKEANKLLCVHREKVRYLKSPRFTNLLLAIIELEKVFYCNRLDVEFAIDHEDRLYILQVRKLVDGVVNSQNSDAKLLEILDSNYNSLSREYDENKCEGSETTLFKHNF